MLNREDEELRHLREMAAIRASIVTDAQIDEEKKEELLADHDARVEQMVAQYTATQLQRAIEGHENGGTRPDTDEEADAEAPPSLTPLDRLRGSLLTAEALAQMPPPEWLVEGMLVRDSLALLYGKPGSYKTFVAVDWTLSIATGSWWLGHAVEAGAVLYVAAEGVRGLGQRVEAWKAGKRVHTAGRSWWLPEAVNLLDGKVALALSELAEELEPDLVVVDTLARSMIGGDENAARDMGLAIDAAEYLRRQTGACVLLIHHDTKEGGTPRGSSALLGAVTTSIECAAEGSIVRLRCEKQKDAPEFDQVRLAAVSEGASVHLVEKRGEDDDMAETGLLVLQALIDVVPDDPATGEPIGVSPSVWLLTSPVAERTHYRWRKILIEKGLVAVTGQGGSARYTPTTLGKRAVLDG